MSYRPSRGVYQTSNGKWIARISDNGARRYLGTFDSESEALKIYSEEFGKLPVPIDNLTGATDVELAWAAGLIDGEGTIIIVKSNPSPSCSTVRHQLRVDIGMANKRTVDRLQCIFGRGFVSRKPNKPHDIYTWSVSVHNASAVLRLILPHLFTKRDQALLALEFEECRNPHVVSLEELELREGYYRKLQALKIEYFA